MKEYPLKDLDRLAQHLTHNHFENYGDGYDSDGAIVFYPNRTFTLWGVEGNWNVLSPSKFEIIFGGEGETYQF